MAAYFILSDKHFFISLISKLIPFSLLNRVNRSINAIKNMVFIEVLLASVTTILYIEGFCILKIESPFLLSLFCGILVILPYIETIIMFVPIIILKPLQKNI